MKRNIVTSIVLVLGALLLAACSTAGGDPGLPERTELAPAGEGAPAHTGNIVLNETQYFAVNGADVEGDLMIIELTENLRLELTSRTGASTTAISTGPGSFAEAEIVVSANGLEPSAIRYDPADCRGSCIVLPARDEVQYFQVSGALLNTSYSVYVYGAQYVDDTEPTNNGRLTAATYVLGEEDDGAIETLDDEDWWIVAGLEGSAGMEFLAPGGLDIQLFVVDATGERGPFPSGEVVELTPGDLLRVESTSSQAARGSNGYYYFSPIDIVDLDMPGAAN